MWTIAHHVSGELKIGHPCSTTLGIQLWSTNKDLEKLKTVVELLVQEQILPERYRDHNLVGDWSGYRECHIEPDWLLLYKIERDEESLTLVRTGTHSDLFK